MVIGDVLNKNDVITTQESLDKVYELAEKKFEIEQSNIIKL